MATHEGSEALPIVSKPRLTLVPPPPAAGPRRSTPKSDRTRAAILEAGVDCLTLHGFHGATLIKVAEIAGLTRGAVQYYFKSAIDVHLALAEYVGGRIWDSYEERAAHPPAGRDRIEFAIDLVASPSEDRYRIARLELVAAARTIPPLAAALESSAAQVEARAKRFTGRIFGDPALADVPAFRAARDLAFLVNDWLFVHVFPGDRERRAADVLAALRIALHRLWRARRLDEAPAPKPRVRVKAGVARAPGFSADA